MRGQINFAERAFAYQAAELVIPDGAEVRGREFAGQGLSALAVCTEGGTWVRNVLQELIVGVCELFGSGQRLRRRSWAAQSGRAERQQRTLVLWACSSAWFLALMGGISRDAALGSCLGAGSGGQAIEIMDGKRVAGEGGRRGGLRSVRGATKRMTARSAGRQRRKHRRWQTKRAEGGGRSEKVACWRQIPDSDVHLLSCGHGRSES